MAKKQASTKAPRRAKTGPLAKFLILILLVAIGWQLYNLRTQLAQAQAEQDRYAALVAAQQQENAAISADIAEGPTTEKMEEMARDELDWAFSNEFVFYDKRS